MGNDGRKSIVTSATWRLSKTHTILGVVLMAPLLVTTVTGILLGWYDQLRYATKPYGLSSPWEARLSPTALVAAIEDRYPNHRLEILFMAIESSRAVRAKLGSPSPLTLFVHPATGAVLDARTPAQRDWVDLLYDLHPGKTFGLAGQVTTAVTALGIAIGLPYFQKKRADKENFEFALECVKIQCALLDGIRVTANARPGGFKAAVIAARESCANLLISYRAVRSSQLSPLQHINWLTAQTTAGQLRNFIDNVGDGNVADEDIESVITQLFQTSIEQLQDLTKSRRTQ